MNRRPKIAVLCCLGLCSIFVSGLAQTLDEKRAALADEKRARALERKLQDSTGLPPGFNDFSKQSDQDLMQMLETMKKKRDNLTPDAAPDRGDSWRQFEKDLNTELDRRGRTPDGGWKKPYEDANANKVDINQKLNQQIRSKENTRDMDRKPAENGNNTRAVEGSEKPNGTQPVDAQKPAPKNPDFEKAETVVTEPPPTTVTSIPEPAPSSAEGSRSSTTDHSQTAGGTANEAKQGVAEQVDGTHHAGEGGFSAEAESRMKQNKILMVNKDGKIEEIKDIGAVDIKPARNQVKMIQGPDGKLTVMEYGEGIRETEKQGAAARAKEQVNAQQKQQSAAAADSGSSGNGSSNGTGEASQAEKSAAKEIGQAEGSAARTGENVASTTEGEVKSAVAGEERAAGAGKPAVPEIPAQSEGLWGKFKRWGSNAMEAMWGVAKVEATAQGSTRTIDHAEKKDTIQTALNTIDGEKKTLEQHLKKVGEAYDLGDVADPQKGFNTPEGRAEIDRIKERVGPEKAADLDATIARIQQLDQDKESIAKGRDALKDKWRREGVTDIAASGGLGASTIDPRDLDSIPELKKYVPDLANKPSAQSAPTSSDLVAKTPAEEKLLAALSDPDKRKQFRDDRTDQEILDTFRATGSLKDLLRPKSTDTGDDGDAKTPERSQSRTADKSPLDLIDEGTDEPPPPKSTDDIAREAKDFGITDGSSHPPNVQPTPSGLPNQAGSLDDFADPNAGVVAATGALVAPGVASGGNNNSGDFDTSRFAQGQAKANAEAAKSKVQGDYAEATRLENALRSAEAELRQAEAEARRAAQRRRQQEIADARRRERAAYERWLAQKRAYDQWAAQQRAAQEQAAAEAAARAAANVWRAIQQPAQGVYQQPVQQPAGHQSGALIDPPQ